MALRQISTNNPEGCVAPGQHMEVIQGVGAARTLLPEESGSLCILDSAAGVVFTLPVPVVGMYFEFAVTVNVTSNLHKVITDSATSFMKGGIIMGDQTVATSGDYFTADGNTHVAIAADGTTKGGLIGERYRLVAMSATVWLITGVCHGAGTLVTPFATS